MKLKMPPEYRIRIAADRYGDPDLHECAFEIRLMRDRLTLEKRKQSLTAALLLVIVFAVVAERVFEVLM